MAGRDIYEYIRLKGARWGVGPSPFSTEASVGQSSPGGLGPTALTRMGRVGGLGNGGGKLQTAIAQGRGAPAIIRPSGYAGHRQPAKAGASLDAAKGALTGLKELTTGSQSTVNALKGLYDMTLTVLNDSRYK